MKMWQMPKMALVHTWFVPCRHKQHYAFDIIQIMNTILHFNSCYQQQNLPAYLTSAAEFDFTHTNGVRGYCDDASAAFLRNMLVKTDPSGIHFLGSGNYHYISLFFLEALSLPFSLVVFDHHTDMQPSMFGDLLSCGSWILHALKTLPQLKEVLIIGVGRESLDAVKETVFPTKAFTMVSESPELLECCYCKQKEKIPVIILKENAAAAAVNNALSNRLSYPVFLSIDKDVLSPGELTTDWDQGSMTVMDLCAACRLLSQSSQILGMDICGEPETDKDFQQSLHINRELIRILAPLQYFQP